MCASIKRKWLFAALLVVIVIAAGTFIALRPSPTVPSDDSILRQSTCHLPCWNNLIPGQSTIDEVRAAIPHIAFIRDVGVLHESEIEGKYYIGWQYEVVRGVGGSFIFKDNLLHSIRLRPNLRFSLHDILERYGDPAGFDYLYMVVVDFPNANLELHLYYPHWGLVIPFTIYSGYPPSNVYEGQPIFNYPILPDTLGTDFELFPAVDSLEELVAENFDEAILTSEGRIHYWFHVGWPGLYSIIANPALSFAPATPFILTPNPADLTRAVSATAAP